MRGPNAGATGWRKILYVSVERLTCASCWISSLGSLADQAVEIGAGAVWFQLDVIDDEAYARVTSAGLDMVMNRCPAIEWSRHGPR